MLYYFHSIEDKWHVQRRARGFLHSSSSNLPPTHLPPSIYSCESNLTLHLYFCEFGDMMHCHRWIARGMESNKIRNEGHKENLHRRSNKLGMIFRRVAQKSEPLMGANVVFLRDEMLVPFFYHVAWSRWQTSCLDWRRANKPTRLSRQVLTSKLIRLLIPYGQPPQLTWWTWWRSWKGRSAPTAKVLFP